MRRKDRAMNQEFACMAVDKCYYAVLATVNADGTPYCVPVCIVRIDQKIYFHCATAGQKIDNMRRDNRVCLSCTGEYTNVPEEITTEYESATIIGRSRELVDQEERIGIMKVFLEKYAPEYQQQFDETIREATPDKMGLWEISIETITGKCNDIRRRYTNYKMLSK